jgi:predicted NAD-dependent protein-ADP-ribosyltransferase YbiA (DUF1768 family)
MKTDITQEDLDYLLNSENYNIDIHLGGNSRSVYLNAKTLVDKYSLITENKAVRSYLQRNFEMGAAKDLNTHQLLSNMPNVTIPLQINGNKISITNTRGGVERYVRSSEHLYQAFRFVDNTKGYQEDVLAQNSSMAAKKKAKRIECRPYHKECFQNIDYQQPDNTLEHTLEVIRIMYQVLLIKLAYKQKLSRELVDENFGRKLLQTGDKTIIEVAPKQKGRIDTFWGTKINADGTLTGRNIMGKLLMFVRDNYLEDVKGKTENTRVVNIPEDMNLNLLGTRLSTITAV